MTALDNAERALAKLVEKERQAGAEEERTARVAAGALAAFHEDGSPTTRERMRSSAEDAERARALRAKAREAVAQAVAKRDELQKAEQVAPMRQ